MRYAVYIKGEKTSISLLWFFTWDIVITGQVIVFIDDITVSCADSCGYLRIPYLSADKAFKRLRKPCKVGVSVAYSENRNVYRHFLALRESCYLDRKIAEVMELAYLFGIVYALAESIVENTLEFLHNFIHGAFKEVCIEIVDEISLDEHLQTEVNDLVPALYTAHTGSVVRHGESHFGVEHIAVNGLVEITHEHRADII